MSRVLLVDDDAELREMLVEYLEGEGFVLATAADGEAGLQRALAEEFDVLLLDVMMPKLNGFDVLRKLRQHSRLPVIMLTAKGDEVDRIVGLEMGADDYLPKPFNPRELAARLRAVLRRSDKGEDAREVIRLGALEIDPGQREAVVGGQSLHLTSTEFSILAVLAARVGEVVSKEALSQQALGKSLQRYDRSLDMHLSNIRGKFKASGRDCPIVTVRGIGYQLARGG